MHVGTDLNKLLSIVESISSSKQVATCDEILSRGDDGFSVTRCD